MREQFRMAQRIIPMDRAQRVGRLLLLCVLVGVLVGLAATFFEWLTQLATYGLLDGLAGYRPSSPPGEGRDFGETTQPFRPWVLALLPLLGGGLGALLVMRFAPEAEGHGTDSAIDAFHNRKGEIRFRVPFIKSLASAITLGTGGSAGKEGPIAHIGAGVASATASLLKLSARERRVLMVAGLGAGVGAVFRAPLAGALFAAEVLYREMDLEFEVLVPAVIASIVAYSTFAMAFGADHLFVTPPYSFDHPLELLPYLLLALVVAAAAKAHVTVFHATTDLFHRLPIPKVTKPMLGGLGAGLFAFFLPEALGSGYGLVQQALGGHTSVYLLAAVVVGKMVTTSLTVGSGQSGGVFGPSIVIGAAVGGVVGFACHAYWPGPLPPHGAFVIVGMAGFFAAAANTPLSTVIMVSEMIGSYRLLVPTMWVCVVAFILVRRSTLYRHQLSHRTASPVHLDEMLGDVLQHLSVRDALRDPEHEPTVTVRLDLPLREILAHFGQTHHAIFPVVDDTGGLIGVVDDNRLRHALASQLSLDDTLASDLMADAPRLTASENLYSAMHKMVESKHDELVVVEEHEPTKVLGTLSRRDLVAAYDHRIRQWGDDGGSLERTRS
ncbi:MAG: chloride channel protein [Myxococcales bacterium]|nr:chloride channel protein [Myxococcales bacterium]